MQKKYGKLLACILAFLLAGAFYCFSFIQKEEPVWEPVMEETEPFTEITQETFAEPDGRIYVHICGEVLAPGVYEMPEGSRVYELLSIAGGATDKGAPDTVNLAGVLKDGERVVIPSEEEAASMAEHAGAEDTGLVNINTASAEQLMTLPGIGESKARDIIQYREESGGFQTIEDIMKISGIKEAVFRKIQSLITV